jgi:hypothetical protein
MLTIEQRLQHLEDEAAIRDLTTRFPEQVEAARIAGCSVIAITPSDYNKWLGIGTSTSDLKHVASDAGIAIAHIDPFVRWTEDWKPQLQGMDFPVEIVGFDEDDFFRMAAALGATSFTAWSGFAAGRYSSEQIEDAFGNALQACRRGGTSVRLGIHFCVRSKPSEGGMGDTSTCGRSQ